MRPPLKLFAWSLGALGVLGCSSTEAGGTGDAGGATGGTATATGGASDGGTLDDGGGTGGASGTGGNAAACLPALARCTDDPGACCDGSRCVDDDDGERRCRETCSERADCGTYCCVDGLCAAEDQCPAFCVEEGGECLSPGPKCCESLICVASTSAEFAGCRPACNNDDDCAEGCCIPFQNGESGFCIQGGACQCSSEDETCGGTRHCCDGLTCTTFDDTGAFACKPRCTENGDCDTNCCVTIAGTSDKACLPAGFCGG